MPTTTSQFSTTDSHVDVQARTQLNGNRSIGGRNKGWGGSRAGRSVNDGEYANPQQRHGNWEHKDMLTPISYKHTENTTMKELVDPRAQMILVTLQWEKNVEKCNVIKVISGGNCLMPPLITLLESNMMRRKYMHNEKIKSLEISLVL